MSNVPYFQISRFSFFNPKQISYRTIVLKYRRKIIKVFCEGPGKMEDFEGQFWYIDIPKNMNIELFHCLVKSICPCCVQMCPLGM